MCQYIKYLLFIHKKYVEILSQLKNIFLFKLYLCLFLFMLIFIFNLLIFLIIILIHYNLLSDIKNKTTSI